jgi:D-amino peptidase
MKVYISADIEGVAGITNWEEADPSNPRSYREFQERMTDEVLAACQGALDAGAREIWVKDAHWHGRNLLGDRLPRETRVIRGWSRHPYMMVQELDSSFAACAFVGYHSRAGSGGNPLAHTMSSSAFFEVKVNGLPWSEFHLYSQAASLEGVPSVFVAGDEALCAEVKAWDERIETVATKSAQGHSTNSLHPAVACERIREGMKRALSRDFSRVIRPLAPRYEIEITYKASVDAYRNSFYPGARLVSDHVVGLGVENYFDVLRFVTFATTRST